MFLSSVCCAAATIKEILVKEGDSLTLHPDHTEIQTADEGEWSFGDKGIIAKFNKNKSFFIDDKVLDGRFKDRVMLSEETGSLTITNARTEHTGLYKLKIINRTGTSSFDYNVIVEGK